MDLKKITLILSLALFAQHANAMENSSPKCSQEQAISKTHKKVKQNEISSIEILPAEIIAATIGWCINLSEDENALAKNITSLLRVNKSFNELINQYPEILKIVINRFEQIKKNFFAQHNLNYDFMIHRFNSDAQTLLSKADLLSKIKTFSATANLDALIVKNEKDKSNLLRHAIDTGSSPLIIWLALCNGANYNPYESGYFTTRNSALWHALHTYRNDAIQMLLDKRVNVNNLDRNDEQTDFATAVEMTQNPKANYKDFICQMIEKGANINGNAKNKYGESTLILAMHNLEIMQLLINKGADIFTLTLNFKTAYDTALTAEKNEAAEILRREMNIQCKENNEQKIHCKICSKEINFDFEIGFKLPCDHIFHKNCIIKHIMTKSTNGYYDRKKQYCTICSAN